jgi:hypothetical protein
MGPINRFYYSPHSLGIRANVNASFCAACDRAGILLLELNHVRAKKMLIDRMEKFGWNGTTLIAELTN